MLQYHRPKTLGFGFLIFSACTSTAPEDSTPLGSTSGNSAGGSSTVSGTVTTGTVAGVTGDATAGGSSTVSGAVTTGTVAGVTGDTTAGGSSAVSSTGGTEQGGVGGITGTSVGGAPGGVGGTTGNPSTGSTGAENGGTGGGVGQPTSCTPARPHDPGRTPVDDIQHDGNDRDYVLFVPTGYDGTERLPLVVNLHGGSSFAMEELDRSKWDEMGEQENFVVVAPNGIDRSWNAGFGDDGRDDVGFIRAVVADVAAELCIDEKRVYVSGHSNGGAMTHKLGCEAADLFAAMAPICGWTEPEIPCNPARPMSVAAVRSLDDPTVQYEGGGRAPSAAEDLQRWLDVNECEEMPVVTSHDDMCTTRTSCKDGTQVMECHPPGNHGFYYNPSNPLPLPDTLWPFFRQFAIP